MTEESPYAPIDEACPACGLSNVWMCSLPTCPKAPDQAKVRSDWVERQCNPPEESETGIQVKHTPGKITVGSI